MNLYTFTRNGIEFRAQLSERDAKRYGATPVDAEPAKAKPTRGRPAKAKAEPVATEPVTAPAADADGDTAEVAG